MIVLSRRSDPAERWLAHLARAAVGSVRAGDPFDDELPFDAKGVMLQARRHRLAPLLHRGVTTGRIADPLPESFREACRRLYYATARKNVVALDSGRQVLRALADAGIPAAPVKGWALVDAKAPVYPDPGVRPMDDLDLIVPRERRARAMHVLARLGFARTTGGRAALVGGHEVAFHRRVADVNVFVELHWAWAGSESLMRGHALPGGVFLRDLCARSDIVRGARAPTWLGHVLFGAVHGARHAWERWLWLLDLHLLVTRRRPDWPLLVSEARARRMRAPAYAGLAAARELFRTPVPKEVLARLSPGPVRRRLLHRTLAVSQARPADRRPARLAKLLLGESWWDVARTAAWAARPGPAWHAARASSGNVVRRGAA